MELKIGNLHTVRFKSLERPIKIDGIKTYATANPWSWIIRVSIIKMFTGDE